MTTDLKLLRVPQAASDIRVSTSTLAKTRLHGVGPPYSKAERRIVVYVIKQADKWLAESTPRSTKDASGV
jgi:hypothetical protein